MRTVDFGHFFKIHSSGKFAHQGSAFFLKILYGRVTRFELVKAPACALGPATFVPYILGSKKK